MIDISINGLAGIFILLATFPVLGLAALVALIVAFVNRNETQSTTGQTAVNFFLSAAILLIFDGFILTLLISQKTLASDQARSLDWWMVYVWIPAHLAGYFLIGFGFRYIRGK